MTYIFHKGVNKIFQVIEKMEKNPTIMLVVAAALINEQSQILLQMRPEGRSMAGLWEFPGGKVEDNELPKIALIRELEEELGVVIDPDSLAPITFASEPLGEKHLLLLLYLCRAWQGEPTALESPQIMWCSIDDMRTLPMPPADGPFIDALEKWLS
jgi:8-oxo-dGTP diphosphatase